MHICGGSGLRGFAPGFVNYKKGYTRFAAAMDKAYQLLTHGGWFLSGYFSFFHYKTVRHDIAEILLKVALRHTKINLHILLRFLSHMLLFRLFWEDWIWLHSLGFNCIASLNRWKRICTIQSNTPYTLEKWWQRWDLGMIENEIVFVLRYIVTQRGFIIVVLACVLIKLC